MVRSPSTVCGKLQPWDQRTSPFWCRRICSPLSASTKGRLQPGSPLMWLRASVQSTRCHVWQLKPWSWICLSRHSFITLVSPVCCPCLDNFPVTPAPQCLFHVCVCVYVCVFVSNSWKGPLPSGAGLYVTLCSSVMSLWEPRVEGEATGGISSQQWNSLRAEERQFCPGESQSQRYEQ